MPALSPPRQTKNEWNPKRMRMARSPHERKGIACHEKDPDIAIAHPGYASLMVPYYHYNKPMKLLKDAH
jgi:hypothetical protein